LAYIFTYSGHRFDPISPDRDLIDIRDIAHALSMTARFGGHTREFYSVAEHSVRVSLACANRDALAGLLHDAAEAYLTDMPKPVKDQLPEYEAAELKLLAVILPKFGLSTSLPASVHRADRLLLNTEARDLFPGGTDWYAKDNCQPRQIRPLTQPAAAERWFHERFRDLTKRAAA
jgi:hypothetical protein